MSNKSLLILVAFMIGLAAFVYYWRTSVEDIPGDYETKKGNYKLEDGFYEDAMAEFKRALDRTDTHPGALLGLSVTYMQMERNEDAMNTLNRLIEVKPDFAIAFADRGILYDKLGKYELALADYKQAIRLDPDINDGPGFLWRFMRNISEKPPNIIQRAYYIQEEMKKPPEERLLKVKEIDDKQRMYKTKQ